MPPSVRMRPSSTVMLPGPTCFQPVRSLPLKSGFHAGACGGAAATASRVEMAASSRSVVFHLCGGTARCGAPWRNLAWQGCSMLHPCTGESKLQVVKVVVADLDVVEG